ncbi:PREDICTED: uncharacterized protein LOC109151170 [Ipomoea nil]|uniref:uncharacterized protein LOC109151170 n=1 Tax=Ipomoea nil TaxID=35883 RepID=UPI000901BC6F|nr:PREDICTED: uncharacterized protein LOC109151170 [Ipomoea nil]
MALETWLIKVKKTIARATAPHHHAPKPTIMVKKSPQIGVLAFEISGLMAKLLHLWQSLSDKNVTRLRGDAVALEGVRKIVSNDDGFLLGLACAELVENLRVVAKSVARIGRKCDDPKLRSFERLLNEFANSGKDPHGMVVGWKEMEAKIKKMDRYVSSTALLHKQMDELSGVENSLKKAKAAAAAAKDLESSGREKRLIDLHQKLQWQKQQIKYLKEKSLWSKTFDTVTLLLARSIFTTLSRIKIVFGINNYPSTLPRSLSASATVHPSENPPPPPPFVSGPLVQEPDYPSPNKFFSWNSDILKPPATTLGAAALALHYANLIIVMEKMIRSPQLVGVDARDDLYSMLPNSIRSSLRARLKGVGFSATDPALAGEWRDALQKILGWLSPLAHNMIKWQSERSFEHQNLLPKTNVLLLQTLFFANQEKTEAAITELLVGLNYIWRFEREMNAKALFECTNFNTFLNLQEFK